MLGKKKCDDDQSHNVTVQITISAIFLAVLTFILILLHVTGSIKLCSEEYLIFCAIVILGLIVTIAAGILYKILKYIDSKKKE